LGRRRYVASFATFDQVLETLNNNLKPTLVQKFSKIKVHSALALAILLTGSEIWTFKKKKNKRVPSIFKDESTGSCICLRSLIHVTR
jgi:hypothetical protein